MSSEKTDERDLFKAQVFLDDSWIEDSCFVQRVRHQALKYTEPVLTCELQGKAGTCTTRSATRTKGTEPVPKKGESRYDRADDRSQDTPPALP